MAGKVVKSNWFFEKAKGWKGKHLAMKAFVSTLKKSRDEKQREMGSYIDHSYDISDIKFIEPVVAYLQGGSVA